LFDEQGYPGQVCNACEDWLEARWPKYHVHSVMSMAPPSMPMPNPTQSALPIPHCAGRLATERQALPHCHAAAQRPIRARDD
jgi:hypothetical protein